jgi:hypothetical protein
MAVASSMTVGFTIATITTMTRNSARGEPIMGLLDILYKLSVPLTLLASARTSEQVGRVQGKKDVGGDSEQQGGEGLVEARDWSSGGES